MISLLYADAGAAPQAAPSPLMSLAPILVIFVIFYFLLIRPQQKKLKDQKKMIDSVVVGDKIITSSGFYATVASVGDSTLEIKLADNVRVKILKSSVSEVLRPKIEVEPAPELTAK